MEQRSRGRRRIRATRGGKGRDRERKRVRVGSEVVLAQVSIEELDFTVGDEGAKVGDIMEEG